MVNQCVGSRSKKRNKSDAWVQGPSGVRTLNGRRSGAGSAGYAHYTIVDIF